MGAGDAEYPAALQHVLGQPLRAGNIRQAFVEDGFEQWIAARNSIADYKNVGVERQLSGIEAFDQFDSGTAQLIAHRGVNVGIAAGYLVAGIHRQLGDTAHEGAADAQNMNVHVT